MPETIIVEGLTNREFFERYAAPGRVGLSGGPELVNRFIMRSLILLVLAVTLNTACADDLDVIVDKSSSAASRGQAYQRLTSAEFPVIAAKLATLIGTHPLFTNLWPGITQPWAEPQLSEDDRIASTLYQLWSYHTEPGKPHGQNLGLMLALLEDAAVGTGRSLALSAVSSQLHFGDVFSDPSQPSLDRVLTRLDRLAHDPRQPGDLRRRVVTILFEHGDPNNYLDLAIELSAAEATSSRQAESFRFCTPTRQSSKLTRENRKKYLKHSYQLLGKIDDGRSGSGYFLAMHIGEFVGIPPVRSGQGAFAPDQRLPQYQGPHGLTESFFQDTVINALKWWNDHKVEY